MNPLPLFGIIARAAALLKSMARGLAEVFAVAILGVLAFAFLVELGSLALHVWSALIP